jgi:hypothetical protein
MESARVEKELHEPAERLVSAGTFGYSILFLDHV